MKKLFTLSVLCIAYCSTFFAQNISGKIVDPDDQPVGFANVILYAAEDSSMVKVELSDEDGNFRFRQIPSDNYWIKATYVGMPAYETAIFELHNDYTLPTIKLEAAATELEQVTVTAQRPLLEMKPDKMVFNVEGSINASGSSALELLRKAPGVVVDNNDNISMLGKSGVQVYIDGKPSPLSTDDLAAYLKTIQASEIDNIEIITNPSAKYDAEGTGGIINIRMKKDKRLGANANLNLGYSIGEKAQYNGSINTNYRDKKYNLFANYGYNQGENYNFFNLYREQFGLVFDQRTTNGGEWKGHNFKTGVDYFINQQHTIGLMVNGNISSSEWASESRTKISMAGQAQVDSMLIAQGIDDNEHQNYNFNLNYRFDNGKGASWNVDADYGLYRREGSQYQPNTYRDASGQTILQERNYRFITPTDIDILTFKADYERPLLAGKLGAGVKTAYVMTDNTFDFYNVVDGNDQIDLDQSNTFTYTENVNAAYVNYSRQIKQFGIQAGVRMEQTNSEGDLESTQDENNKPVERSYLDFFPSAGISYQVNPKNSLQLTYSRRINRPSYQDLNPFQSRLDELTFEKGNPFLNPEYTNSVQLTHTFNYSINTSIGFSHTTDVITRLTDTLGQKASFINWQNLADQYNYNLSISGAIPLTKWWSSYTNLTGYIQRNKADYGDNKTVDITVKAFNVYSQHTFRLPWDLSFEVSGWYSSPSLWGGTFETDAIWSMDAGIQKKVFNGRGNLRISLSDIFKSNEWSGVSRFGELFLDTDGGWDSRRFRVNFSYLFGNNQVKVRKRKSGLEDESNRIKSDN